ncbi:MAG: DUF1851 domain-containing protein [Nocardia sp.]|nr:DUF1851 domain-containing protein [Nocardia sp.]
MSRETGEFIDVWGEASFPVVAAPERFEEFAGVVPDLLLRFWRELGFSGFGDGALWLCDPVRWQPAVDAWTADLDLPMGEDSWIAVSRTAFGEMHLWGKRTGMSLTVVPFVGTIVPSDHSAAMATPEERDDQIYAHLLSLDPEAVDVDGDEEPLFGPVLRERGPVGPDTMYGFVPVPALGGAMAAERVEIVDAAVHMRLLSELTPRVITADPVARNGS